MISATAGSSAVFRSGIISVATELALPSFSVGQDIKGLVLYGADVAVLPQFQRLGYGRRLADERLRYGRDVGCTRFLGATQPDNFAMLSILEAQGFTRLPLPVPNVFPHGTDAILAGGEIR